MIQYRGKDWNFDISNKQGGGHGKIETEVFLTNWGKMGKLTHK